MIRFLTAVTVLLTAATTLRADVEVEVRFGHGGRAVAGAVTPTLVRLKAIGESAPLRVEISVEAGSYGFRGERCRSSGTLSTGGVKEFRFFLRPTANGSPKVSLGFDRPVVVIDQSKARSQPTRRFSLSPSIPRSNTDNSSPAAIQLLAIGPLAGLLPRTYRSIQVLPGEENDLPDIWHGYDGLDTVYLRNPFEMEPADPVRLRALLTWVELGGSLVISTTRRPDLVRASLLDEALPADLGSPLAQAVSYRDLGRHLGIDRAALGELRKLGPLIELTPRVGAREVRRAMISGESRVVSVSWPHGVGSVTVLAFDPARYETVPNPGAAAVLARVLGFPTAPGESSEQIEQAFVDVDEYPSITPEHDYASGLVRILRLGAVKAPPILLLSLFMMLYVLAVGPLDYFFLKRRGWLKYSALSFVILALVFSVTAWFVSFYLFAGSAKVNRVTFVDVVPAPGDSALDLVSISDYAGYYAPRGQNIQLEVEADTAVFSQIGTLDEYLHWGGSGFTADALEVDSRDPALGQAALSIPFRSLRAARMLALRREAFPLTVEVRPREKTVLVTNDLPYRLRDAIILTPEGAIPVGDLEAGEERTCPLAPVPSGHLLPDATTLTMDPDQVTPSTVQSFGPLFLSVGRYVAEHPVPTGLERLIAKRGFARPYVTHRQRSMLVAWTDARDPFRLPGGKDDGYRVTVIRRILEP